MISSKQMIMRHICIISDIENYLSIFFQDIINYVKFELKIYMFLDTLRLLPILSLSFKKKSFSNNVKLKTLNKKLNPKYS